MQPHSRNSYSITEIHDDGPKWRSVAVLVFACVLLVALVAGVLIFANWLQLDQRAALAISEARQVAEATREYKVMFWIVFWLALALIVSAGALSVSVVFTVRAYQVARDVFEERRIIAYSHSPPSLQYRRPELGEPRSPRQVPAKEPQIEFSRLQEDLQDSSAVRVETRSQIDQH